MNEIIISITFYIPIKIKQGIKLTLLSFRWD